jgi:hypothetical protein
VIRKIDLRPLPEINVQKINFSALFKKLCQENIHTLELKMELDTDRRHLLSSERFVLRKFFQMPEVITNLVFNNDARRKEFTSLRC